MKVGFTDLDNKIANAPPAAQRSQHFAFCADIERRAEALRQSKVQPAPAPAPVAALPAAKPPKPRISIEGAAAPVEPKPAPYAPFYPSIASIKEAVCLHFGVSLMMLAAGRRTAAIVEARQMAYYLCRELTPHSYPLIGKFLGGRDHTTVMYGCRKVAAMMRRPDEIGAEKAFQAAVLIEQLTGVKS
jgi:hypothetical protein